MTLLASNLPPRLPALKPAARLHTLSKKTPWRSRCARALAWSACSALLIVFGAVAAPVKNGFDLAGALVSADRIFQGGPPKDGIASIDHARFVPALQAHFMQPTDTVLGLEFNGVVKAYPIAILNWHEVVNDSYGDASVVVTFCPLCGTGMAFRAEIDGTRLSFGVSGLLYNNDVLLYDRQTDSLWSQIAARAVSGARKGTRLLALPVKHTTWEDWRRRHPDTLLLSTDTGFKRDYRHDPYEGYETSREVFFPLDFRSEGFHPKERVLGVEIKGRFKAYPFVELTKHGGEKIQDIVAGETLSLHFDVRHQTASAYDAAGRELPALTAFWFAWYAFHPDTEVFRAMRATGSR